MSRIGDGSGDGPSETGRREPWPAEAGRHVRRLRGAITADRGSELVDTEVAPLLPDLLTRLDDVSRVESSGDLAAPTPPNSVSPPSPADHMYLLRRAADKICEVGDELAGSRGAAVREMADTVEFYRSLREEVLLRSEM